METLAAGRVARFHSHPGVYRKQSVGEHTYGVSVILCYLFDGYPVLLGQALRYALVHDAAEIVTGDIPFTAKRDFPELKANLERIEATAHKETVLPIPQGVSRITELAVKMADMLEGLAYTSIYEMWPYEANNNWGTAIWEKYSEHLTTESSLTNTILERTLEIKACWEEYLVAKREDK
tara:strand:+ start:6016 stop:6552 length:537 start_codon:yes stop_codon:yes gene_type:complete